MDAFFASVEMRDHPAYANKPLAVGGDPQSRGVIAAANYPARKYGVKSALSSWKAVKLCPDLIIVPPHMERYKEESSFIHEIFHRFTSIIEPLSLDEAFLDVTDCELFSGSATLIAGEIRRLIRSERNLTASAGIAPNKFLAKIASDWNKPDGQYVITPDEVESFIVDLPVEKIFGVGIVTAKKLHSLRIATCGDLQKVDIATLEHHFGSRGAWLYQLARGVDNRPVEPSRIRKSISVEDTFLHDLPSLNDCIKEIPPLMERLLNRFEKIKDQYLITKLSVKIKFSDFTVTTVENAAFTEPTEEAYVSLITTGWKRQCKAVRLLGLGLVLTPRKEQQLSLF